MANGLGIEVERRFGATRSSLRNFTQSLLEQHCGPLPRDLALIQEPVIENRTGPAQDQPGNLSKGPHPHHRQSKRLLPGVPMLRQKPHQHRQVARRSRHRRHLEHRRPRLARPLRQSDETRQRRCPLKIMVRKNDAHPCPPGLVDHNCQLQGGPEFDIYQCCMFQKSSQQFAPPGCRQTAETALPRVARRYDERRRQMPPGGFKPRQCAVSVRKRGEVIQAQLEVIDSSWRQLSSSPQRRNAVNCPHHTTAGQRFVTVL